MDMASRFVHWLWLALAALPALAQPVVKPLEFDVASVRPSDPASKVANVLTSPDESLTIVGVPLQKIILWAYDIRDFQLASAPAWAADERYDIAAKNAVSSPSAFDPATETAVQRRERVARIRERLRSLLADRFALRAHMEEREQTILALRIAKGGPKLSEAAVKAGNVSTGNGRIQGFGAPISMLVVQLSNATEVAVTNETGLGGNYDFTLEWAPDEKDPRDLRPSIFTAVGTQLGLRLERAKGPVKTVVIDHIERPSAN
jgi:uncharacterized protein (TIGR03435 family)